VSVRIPPTEAFEYYLGPDGKVWQVLHYATSPTATLKNLETGETVGGCIGSLNLEPFRRLEPIEPPANPSNRG